MCVIKTILVLVILYLSTGMARTNTAEVPSLSLWAEMGRRTSGLWNLGKVEQEGLEVAELEVDLEGSAI